MKEKEEVREEIKMSKSSKILKTILSLIDKDVKKIKKEYNSEEDKSLKALTLSRYTTILLDIQASQDKLKKEEKKLVENLSTEQLIKEFNLLNNKDKK